MIVLLYIVVKIIKIIVIIQLVNSLYDYFFKENTKNEDIDYRNK